jgi:hypothetical protein
MAAHKMAWLCVLPSTPGTVHGNRPHVASLAGWFQSHEPKRKGQKLRRCSGVPFVEILKDLSKTDWHLPMADLDWLGILELIFFKDTIATDSITMGRQC